MLSLNIIGNYYPKTWTQYHHINCRIKNKCPLNGKCRTRNILNKCMVSTSTRSDNVYLRTTEGDNFKRFYNRLVLVKKSQAEIWKIFSNFQICHNHFFTWKPNPLDLEIVVYPLFAKPVLDIFPVYSLVLRMNWLPYGTELLMPKTSKLLIEKADLRFFLTYVLRTKIKITISSPFYVIDNFSSCYGRNSCKKNRLFQ